MLTCILAPLVPSHGAAIVRRCGGCVSLFELTTIRGLQMRVQVDQDRCHGHQMCAIAAPDVFGSDEIGNAVVLIEGDIPRDLEAAAKRAEGNCPERAIEIRE